MEPRIIVTLTLDELRLIAELIEGEAHLLSLHHQYRFHNETGARWTARLQRAELVRSTNDIIAQARATGLALQGQAEQEQKK